MPLIKGADLLAQLYEGKRFISDGAIGSELIRKGIASDKVLQANLNRSEDVYAVHQNYLDQGSMLLTSNTFGLPGSAAFVSEMQTGLKLAIECAINCKRSIGVLFSLIPAAVEPIVKKNRLFFADLDVESLAVVIETCTSLDEALAATSAVRSLKPGLLAVTCHFTAASKMLDDTPPGNAARALIEAGADVVGANCGDVPAVFPLIARTMRAQTHVPLLFQPSAGLPVRDELGRLKYLIDPQTFAHIAVRLFDEGVQIVGGCCGTTPDHIKAIFTNFQGDTIR